MKKLIALLLCLSLLFAGTACTITTSTNRGKSTTGTPTTVHTHQYDEGVVVTPATCDQSGTKKYTCTDASCGHSYTEAYELPTIPATELFNQAVKYVGEIVTYDKQGNELALGTGFSISTDGKIVTNYHVIEGAYSAGITIDGIKYTIASVLAYDPDIDLAVLKVNATGLTAATVCKKAVSVGSAIYAIGSSRGLTDTFSQGIVTYADRVIDGVSYVQHDASITHGNSGGPLLNSYGEVIGINTWGVSDSQNLNFAVFADELDNLTYGNPMTLAELYKEQITPYEALTNWVLDNYTWTSTKGDVLSAEYVNDTFVYSVSYDLDDGYLFVDFYDEAGYFSLDLLEDTSYCPYYLHYDTNTLEYYVTGEVNANTFTKNTTLRNYEYDGPYYYESDAVSLTHISLSLILSFLDYYLFTNRLNLTIADFGFVAYN